MKKRVITGALLVVLAAVLLYFGGAVLAVVDFAFICVAIWEEFRALKSSGHRVVQWPTWIGLAVGVPLLVYNPKMLFLILSCVFILTVINVLFREKPVLTDISMSLLPVLTVALPGLCIASIANISSLPYQRIMTSLLIAVPCVGDYFALLVGSKVGGKKLCPEVSPHKTVSGSIGGMVGSILAAVIIMICGKVFCSPETAVLLPTWWQYLLLGVLGGIAGQCGDLFASLVKRYCGIKDFSNIFPGHGGMMDRLDSILFMAVVVFLFCRL